MKLKNVLAIVAISAATAFLSVWAFSRYQQYKYAGIQEPGKLPVNYAGFFSGNNTASDNSFDFTQACATATPAVVHIKTRTKAKQASNNLPKRNDPLSDFFGDNMFGDLFGGMGPQIIPEQRASGSGVIISEDGYIVTNNHVVDGADEINVTLPNSKTYKATVVGTDPSSDIAVLKIDAKGLPYLVYGNSDEAKLGQWVLAIGYPLTLDVTVTAGIISAKARNIGINSRQSSAPIESFIQTDAAVNPGNSGGALINTRGELIGINSAIASPTGSYAGYSYAIPVNIVKKVVNDIIKYGTVQRAFLGISYPREGLTDEQKKAEGIKDVGNGIYVMDVPAGGAAAEAGIKKGDIITSINGVNVTTGPEMVEQIARYKPGDKVILGYIRNGEQKTVPVILKNKAGNTNVVKVTSVMDRLGAELVNIDKKTATANNLNGGVLVKKIQAGSAIQKSRIQEGFIITAVNGIEVNTIDDLKAALSSSSNSGTVRFDGIYPGYGDTYSYPVRIDGGE